MKDIISKTAAVVERMDTQLRDDLLWKDGTLQQKKLWENTYISHQMEKRNNGGEFSIRDHIRAMVYAMLSAGASWERLEKEMEPATGRIPFVDEALYQYNPDKLLRASPESLTAAIQSRHLASMYTARQMRALIDVNIPKLLQIKEKYGTIDGYYQQFIQEDSTLQSLVKTLSDSRSKDKMEQLGVALNCEYLRNVGYDIAKPDRHMRRELGSRYLGCSKREVASESEVFDIVAQIAQKSGKTNAEVDYILWSYCAKGYGEVCTVHKAKCGICVAKDVCGSGDR